LLAAARACATGGVAVRRQLKPGSHFLPDLALSKAIAAETAYCMTMRCGRRFVVLAIAFFAPSSRPMPKTTPESHGPHRPPSRHGRQSFGRHLRLDAPELWAVLGSLLFVLAIPLPGTRIIQSSAFYLPLHTAMEAFAVFGALMIFMECLTSPRERTTTDVVLGCGFLAVGLIDFFHLLSYPGMPDFVTSSGPEKAIAFWLAARGTAAVTLLLVGIRVLKGGRDGAVPLLPWAMTALILAVLVNWLVLWHPDKLPRTFVPGAGLTGFKITAEIVIVAITLAASVLLYRGFRRRRLPWVGYLASAAWVGGLGELFFTLYANVTDLYNLLGHLFKVGAYLLILRALVLQLVKEPLDQATSRWRFALESSGQGVWDANLEDGSVYLSPHLMTMLACTPADLDMDLDAWRRRVHPEDAARVGAAFARCLAGEDAEYETRHRVATSRGDWIWVIARGKVVERLADGRPMRMVGTLTDITGQQAAEQHSTQLAARTAALLELRRTADCLGGKEYLQHCLAIAEELTGSTISFLHFVDATEQTIELVTWAQRTLASYCQASHETHYPLAQAGIWADALRQRRVMVFNDYPGHPGKHGLPEGHAALTRLISMPVIEQERVVMLVGVGNKATEYSDFEVDTLQLVANEIWHSVYSEKTLAVLSESEERFRRLFEDTPQAITLYEDGCFTAANAAALAMMGCSRREQLVGRSPLDFSPDHQPNGQLSSIRVEEVVGRAYAEGGARFEWQHLRADGRPILVEVLSTTLRYRGRQFLHSVWTDITERRAQELRLTSALQTLLIGARVANLGVWSWDIPANTLTWDQQMFDIYGVAPALRAETVDYAFWTSRVHPDDLPAAEAKLNAQIDGTGLYDPTFRIVLGDGSLRYVQAAAFIERNAAGTPIRMIGVNRDVTDQILAETRLREANASLETRVEQRTVELEHIAAELRESEARFREMSDVAPVLIWMSGVDGLCFYFNQGWLNFTGRSQEQEAGNGWAQGVHPDDLERCLDIYSTSFQARQPFSMEYRLRHHGGAYRWILDNGVPRFDSQGRFVGYIGGCIDIEEIKRAEAEREAAHAATEHLARMKSQFLTNMSHEIRTPLNGVLGMAQIGYRDSDDDSKARGSFKHILDSGKLLLTVINDILDFSKIEAGKLDIESVPVDPARLADDALHDMTDQARAKGLRLFVTKNGLPARCLTDPTRIAQILLNLLSNAIKFTVAGEVRLDARGEGDALVFEVCDTGVGIAPEVVQRLFQPFEQADSSTTRKHGGTGLGLVISRRLAELMGGSLKVDSVPGQGSRFTLRLPLRVTEQAVAARPVAPASDGRRLAGLCLLVAEDTEINQIILDDVLRREGAEVVMAGNGQAAIDCVEANPRRFDAVLMDVQMPVMDGLQATRRLAQTHPGLPVIGQTAHALKEEFDRCIEAGMVATVTKPIDIEVLVATLLAQLGRSGDRRRPLAAMDSAAAPAEPAAAIVDWSGLCGRYASRPDFLGHLLKLAVDTHADHGQELRRHAAAGDLAAIGALAHQLKGVGGNLFALQLDALAKRAMLSARSGEPACAEHAIALADALERLIAEFRLRLSANPP